MQTDLKDFKCFYFVVIISQLRFLDFLSVISSERMYILFWGFECR